MSDRTKQYIAWTVVVIAVLVAGWLGVVYPLPASPAAEAPGMISFSATGGGEGYTNLTSLALSNDLYVGNDASVIGDLDAATLDIAGAFDIDGAVTLNSTLDVDGAVTLNSTLDADGATTLNGTLDVDGNVSSGTGAFTITDSLNVTGAADFDSTVNADGGFTGNVSGATYVTSTNLAGSLAGNVTGNVIGYVAYQRPLVKTTSYTLTASDSGSTVYDLGASAVLTFTLPTIAASPNYWYCFYVFEAYTVTIKPAASDQIHALTNAANDRIQNVGTAGDSVCLLNVNDTYWIPTQKTGTWTDVD